MNIRNLIHRNITFFSRYYKLMAVAVLITIGVIVGSMMVGDSVRATLIKRVTERLGDTETIVFSRNSFMSEEVVKNPLFGETARGMLLTNGFISQNGRLVPVFVWGTDDLSIPRGSARINQALLSELGKEHPDDMVLRLPASGLVPSGSLFVTENYTTSIRLTFDGIVHVEEGGNISMKNEQVIPLNIFVNRTELAEVVDTEKKINLILSDRKITSDELNKAWNYTTSGLSVTSNERFTEITSDRIFLQEKVVETIRRDNHRTNRLFSYLANSIERDTMAIPYSFVTALDCYTEEPLQKGEIILSDYSAKRLLAKPGDTVQVSFYISQDLKTLKEDTVSLRVKAILPIAELMADSTLSTDFPGLSDVERCTDWDSDLPINMNQITDEDEAYWERYRSTPKALIAYETVAGKWGNAYGNATAIRVAENTPNLSELYPEMFGIQVIHPREAGLYAARNGVDFAGLFLALGFFIIVSAMLLMLIPISEMLYQRRHEITLLKTLGYTRKRIIRILWMEAAPIVLITSIAGVITGLLYTTLIIWLLGNVWKGATHTEGFAVYPNLFTVATGLFVGISLSLFLLRKTIVQNLKERKQHSLKQQRSLQRKKAWAMISGMLIIGITAINFIMLHTVALFVLSGIIIIGAAAIWGDYLICRNSSFSNRIFNVDKLKWSTLLANKKQAILSFLTLAIGVFIVFSVGLNRKGFADNSQIRTGTGGYSLWCESSVPIYHNISTQSGREKLSLTALSQDIKFLQCLRYNADEASCLNLNKVSTPTVLGVDMTTLSDSDFEIEQNMYGVDRETFFKRMQVKADSVYPALVDATVLTWSLVMNIGDTLYYEKDSGKRVAIQLVGTLSNSIFQGNILVDRSLFSEIWEETTGSEVFLLKTPEAEKETVKALLSQALNEYGVRITTTNDRLKQFNTVTDTYLTIFMTLGSLGLLLGIMSFIIVIRKNLTARRKEIDLYRTLGFPDDRIERILYKENLIVPLYAIVTGVISSMVGVSVSFMNANVQVWLLALLFALLFVGCVLVFVKRSIRNKLK